MSYTKFQTGCSIPIHVAASRCLTRHFFVAKSLDENSDMSKRILSVSYDESLLATRQMVLEQHGYKVTSALGFKQGIAHCRTAGFDLFILGHSIPIREKEQLIKTFRNNCPAPVLSLSRIDEETVPSDFQLVPDKPEELITTVGKILSQELDPSRFMIDAGENRSKSS